MIALARPIAPGRRSRRRRRELPGQLPLPLAAAEARPPAPVGPPPPVVPGSYHEVSRHHEVSSPPPPPALGPDDPDDEKPWSQYVRECEARKAEILAGKVELAMKCGSHHPAPKRQAGIRRLRGGRFDIPDSE